MFSSCLRYVPGTSANSLIHSHFKNWNGHSTDMAGFDQLKLSDGTNWPDALAKDFCSTDPKCDAFVPVYNSDHTVMRTMDVDADHDIYLNIDAAVIKGDKAFCVVDGAWLNCQNNVLNILGSFDLPPDLVSCACTSNPECLGFSVKNDGTAGSLFKLGAGSSKGFFKLPAGQPAPAQLTTVNATACAV